ncbi:MAG TPA: hypothetical protein VN908_09025 [Gemmatimonadales bacterium]|nr:hypothetical protein [Gemmatimonadales bacterium]
MNRRLLPLVLLVAACGRGTSSGSPTCGIALIAGPALIQQQLTNARAVITDPPRGLPDSLPAVVIQQKPGAVIVGRDAEQRISMQYRGPGFPAQGYGLLVVDDTSGRALGVLIFEQPEPKLYPRIGAIIGGSAALSVYGVRVDWSSVSNPRCPLFGAPASPTS